MTVRLSQKSVATTVSVADLGARTKAVDNTVLNITGSGGTTITSVTHASAFAFRDSNNVYWLTFSVRVNKSNIDANCNFQMSGVTSSVQYQAVNIDGSVAGNPPLQNRFEGDGEQVSIVYSGGTAGETRCNGTIIIDKPSWFDANQENSYSVGASLKAATTTLAGTLPPVTSMSDSLATSLGYKKYVNGENGLTITPAHGSVGIAYCRPIEMNDGTWLLEVNIKLQGVNTIPSNLTISGITSTAGNTQALAGGAGGAPGIFCDYMRVSGGGNQIDYDFNGNPGDVLISGTFAIQGKPTWAY